MGKHYQYIYVTYTNIKRNCLEYMTLRFEENC